VKAAVLFEIPGRLEIADVEVGTPSRREVLVRTVAAGLCHSDLHFMEGKYPYPTPAVLGHESAGVVEAVGEDVTYVQPGDHVITCLSVFCGRCSYCLDGHLSLCEGKAVECVRRPDEPPRLTLDGAPVHQFLHLSSYGEMMLVHEHAVVKIRPDMPLDRAALIGCGVTTGMGAVFRTAAVRPGEDVAVIGCGGIGLAAVQGARIAGAGRVIAVDLVASKLEMARQMGATDTVDAGAGDPITQVKELTGGGVHHAFEAVGAKVTAEQAFGMLRNGGTATIIGMIPVGTKVELHGVEFLYEKKLQGSNMGSNQFRTDMPRFVDMYLKGQLLLDEMVSARIGLDDVNAGFEAMKAGEVARSVIMFDGS
jgi:S-(hydroxymethyl)glutathione dehydrogenase/alcohol dehydrogenase